MEYTCNDCGMGVEGLSCSKCGAELKHATETVNGKKVQVAKCPNDCGMIKSPQCCNKDMQAQS